MASLVRNSEVTYTNVRNFGMVGEGLRWEWVGETARGDANVSSVWKRTSLCGGFPGALYFAYSRMGKLGDTCPKFCVTDKIF